jgi:hypothetical protein
MRPPRWLKNLLVAQTGSVLVLSALSIALAGGLTGLSVDVGKVFMERRHLQNAVDAASLAAVLALPGNTTAASADANSWVGKNGFGPGDTTSVVFSNTYTTNDTVTVTVSHDVDLFLAPVFGKSSSTVTASAKAVVGGYRGGRGIMPWGLITEGNPCYSGTTPIFGASCTLKLGAGSGNNGNYGALRLGGNGASVYRSNIINGTTGTYVIGQVISLEHGNMVGPTRQGIEGRLDREPTSGCGDGSGQDTFTEVFTLGVGGTYTLNCPESPRWMVIPVIDDLTHSTATIISFALLYLEDFDFQGGHSEVTGRLVSVNLPSTDVTQVGGYQGNGLRVVRLDE